MSSRIRLMNGLKKLLFLTPGRVISLLPRSFQLALGRILGRLAMRLTPKRVKITRRNFEIAFPEKDATVLTRKCFEHFGCLLVETLCLPFFGSSLKKWLTFEGMEVFQEHQAKGEGSILLTAHFGNWETMSWCNRHANIIVYGLYQKQNNTLANDWFYELRRWTGLRLIEKKSGLKKVIGDALVRGETFGLVGDQGRGQYLEFFGRETNFPVGPAWNAIEHNCRLYFTLCIREGKYLRMKMLEEIPIQEGDDREEQIRKTTELYIQKLEEVVRKYPEQYFWMHDLWKEFKKKPSESSSPAPSAGS